MSSLHATNASGQLIATSNCLSNEDVCTVKMLGHTHTRLSHQQTATREKETHRKPGTSYSWSVLSTALQPPFKFFSSAYPNIRTSNADLAEIVHFIHAKDGKKRI
ncbi:MAG: hypothetical protein PUD20_06745 [bacterium]|nr:hypothetical protein [bacterium]